VRALLVSAAIVIADQITKMLVRGIHLPALGIHWEGMPLGTSRPVLGEFLRLTYVENPGMAFGIDIGGRIFFSVFSILASIGIITYLYRVRTERLGFRLSLALILGGAVGNLIDRVFYGVLFQGAPLFQGRVVDFLDVEFFDIALFGVHLSRWPVFNIADATVTVGVLLLLVFYRTPAVHSHPVPQSTPGETPSSPGDDT
jgi:signal peptidase II